MATTSAASASRRSPPSIPRTSHGWCRSGPTTAASTATFQATPIVVDGVMYVSLPFSGVAALDAATGRERWRYTPRARAAQKLCCGPANRGVAVARRQGLHRHGRRTPGRAGRARPARWPWDITVAEYAGTTEADAASCSGTIRSRRSGQTGSTGVGISAAPLVYDGKVFVGIAGVGYGLHPDQGLAVVGSWRASTGGRGSWPPSTRRPAARSGTSMSPAPGWEGAFRTATPDGVPMQRDIAARAARGGRSTPMPGATAAARSTPRR